MQVACKQKAMLLQLFGAFGKAFPAATQKLQTHTETLLNSAWHTLTLTQTATADSGQRAADKKLQE